MMFKASSSQILQARLNLRAPFHVKRKGRRKKETLIQPSCPPSPSPPIHN